jgi:hypothetical protein
MSDDYGPLLAEGDELKSNVLHFFAQVRGIATTIKQASVSPVQLDSGPTAKLSAYAVSTSSMRMESSRRHLPVSWKTALAMAGAMPMSAI